MHNVQAVPVPTRPYPALQTAQVVAAEQLEQLARHGPPLHSVLLTKKYPSSQAEQVVAVAQVLHFMIYNEH